MLTKHNSLLWQLTTHWNFVLFHVSAASLWRKSDNAIRSWSESILFNGILMASVKKQSDWSTDCLQQSFVCVVTWHTQCLTCCWNLMLPLLSGLLISFACRHATVELASRFYRLLAELLLASYRSTLKWLSISVWIDETSSLYLTAPPCQV